MYQSHIPSIMIEYLHTTHCSKIFILISSRSHTYDCSSDEDVDEAASQPPPALEQRAVVDIRRTPQAALSAGMKRTLSRTVSSAPKLCFLNPTKPVESYGNPRTCAGSKYLV